MDVERMIEDLKKSCWGNSAHVVDDERRKAAEMIQALQAENARLKYYEDKCHDCPIVCAKTEIIKANEKLERAEAERDAAVRCIDDISEALTFQRITAIGLRISEWRARGKDGVT